MKSYIIQLICWSLLLTVLSACRPKPPKPVVTNPVAPTPVVAIIDKAIPNGLVPGSALTLRGRDFGTVQSVQFANTTVASGTFIRTATDEVTLKVPLNTQAGEVRVVGEKGPGQPKQMALLTGNYGMTADNVSTNVNTVTQGTYSDDCSPKWFSYCMQGTCLKFYDGHRENLGGDSRCDQFKYTTEQIAGSTYNVYKGKYTDKDLNEVVKLTLRCEVNKNGVGFTGLVMLVMPDGKIYFGSVLKNGDVVGYAVDGSELRLCRPVNNPNRPIDRPCFQVTCNACS